MRVTPGAFFGQLFILGGLLTVLQQINPDYAEIFIYAGLAYSFFRPVPNDYLYPRYIIKWQLPFIRLWRAVKWLISAIIAWVVITFVASIVGLI